MSRRIGLWMLAGLAVASLWVVFSFVTAPPHYNFDRWIILSITAPAAIVSRSLHFGVKFYGFIALNGAMYGLVGLALEPFRHIRRCAPAKH